MFAGFQGEIDVVEDRRAAAGHVDVLKGEYGLGHLLFDRIDELEG